MGRSPCCDENGLKKGPWTPEEDKQLVQYIQKHGHGSWRALPKLAGLNRCGKSCRLRWTNYLRPDIKRGKFSADEEHTILNLHSVLGNKWSAIAAHLPGRTDNEIKNFWNTHLKKKLIHMGFDPMTHRPRTDIFSSLPHLIALANLKVLMDQYHPWEEQTMKLQEALQLAKAKCLQQAFLQSAASMSNNPNACLSGINNNTDMDAINLLNSTSYSTPPKVDPMNNIFSNTSGRLESTKTCTSIGFASQLANDHSQQLYVNPNQDLHEYNYQTPMSSEMNQIPNILDAFSQGEIALKSSPMVGLLEPVAENILDGNPSDVACSVASYPGNASSFWPDQLLLEEPFIHDFALS